MLLFSPATAERPAERSEAVPTDADGRYQIGLDAAGSYSVTVSRDAIDVGQRRLRDLDPGSRSAQRGRRHHASSRAGVAGRVTNGEGKPVSGAVATVSPGEAAAGGEGGHGRRGTQDTHRPRRLFPRRRIWSPASTASTVAAVGYRNAQPPPVTISNESDVPSLDVRLEPGRSVRGRVVDANGNGISSAWSSSHPPEARSGRDMLPAISDVNGTFVLTAPADGAIDLTAVATGFPRRGRAACSPRKGWTSCSARPARGTFASACWMRTAEPVRDARIACQAVPDSSARTT